MSPTPLRLAVLLLVAAAAATLAYVAHPELVARRTAAPAADELTMETLPAWAKDALWIDARAREAHEAGHVPGALLLPAGEYDSHLAGVFERWKDGQPVIVYCDGAGCDASRQVARRLREEIGLGETYFLKGGWDAWTRAQK